MHCCGSRLRGRESVSSEPRERASALTGEEVSWKRAPRHAGPRQGYQCAVVVNPLHTYAMVFAEQFTHSVVLSTCLVASILDGVGIGKTGAS